MSSNHSESNVTFDISQYTPTCSSFSLLDAMTPTQSKASSLEKFGIKNQIGVGEYDRNVSPILVQGVNHATAMSTPLIKHKPPDISKCQKRKKFRKRMSNLNKSDIKNIKGSVPHRNGNEKSSNILDCNLVSTKKTCRYAKSHQKQNNCLQTPFSQNKNQHPISKILTDKYITRSSSKK